jgi:hypothetical protein
MIDVWITLNIIMLSISNSVVITMAILKIKREMGIIL